jgi:esterase/lipase superfamily enzyme
MECPRRSRALLLIAFAVVLPACARRPTLIAAPAAPPPVSATPASPVAPGPLAQPALPAPAAEALAPDASGARTPRLQRAAPEGASHIREDASAPRSRLPLAQGAPPIHYAARVPDTSSLLTALQPRAVTPPAKPASVAVFYGTDRQPTGDRRPALHYGSRRGSEPLELGICNVTIPPTHRVGEIETPFIASIPVLQRLSPLLEDPNKHVVVQGIAPLKRADFLRHLRARIDAAPSRDAFVYVHGFNNSFADACRRTAQIAHDLKEFKGVPLMYSWASLGSPSPRAYYADGQTVEWSVPNLERFIMMVANETGATTVHLIAHSMGSRLLAQTLETLALKRSTPPVLGQLVFAAADVDAATFRTRYVPAFRGLVKRTTAYVSAEDEALSLAQKFALYARAGEAGANILVVEGMDTIDTSPVNASLIGHDYLAVRPVFRDLFTLLANGRGPDERCGTQCYFDTVIQGALRYWRFRKGL